MRRTEYERMFAEVVGVPAARAFALGRQALVILLRAIGVRKGDRVGVCGFTCLSVVEAVKDCGAVPVYLDIDETLCISPDAIGRCRPGWLRAVLLQHTLGIPGKLDELLSACAAIGADVIEDCATRWGVSGRESGWGSSAWAPSIVFSGKSRTPPGRAGC